MRQIGEPIDIRQFAADLMSLKSGDIEDLIKELKEHYWKNFDTGETNITPDTLIGLGIIASAKEPDAKKAELNLQVAKWFKKYTELEEQHEEDKSWLEYTNEQIKFWKEFWDYISEKSVGDTSRIIEAIANNDHNWFEGYVKVEKKLNDKQELLIKFTNNKGIPYTAEWQPSDNYACWQTCGMVGDDYSGYLLFPTYKADEYFCMYYTC